LGHGRVDAAVSVVIPPGCSIIVTGVRNKSEKGPDYDVWAVSDDKDWEPKS
jgi:hypothetical protein